MKKFRKLLSLAMAAVLAVSMSACTGMPGGADETETSGSATGTSGDEQITLRFSWWGDNLRHEATLAAIEKYQELHPNVKIEGEYGGYTGFYEKLIAQLGGGNEPDIMQLDAMWIYDLANKGDYFVNMAEQDIVDLSQFDETFMQDNCTVDGTVLGVPTGLNAEVFMVNKDMFDELGVEIRDDYTWNDLIEIGKKLKEKDPEGFLLRGDLINVEYILKKYVIQLTGKEWIDSEKNFGFTEDELAAGYQFILDLIDNNVLPPMKEIIEYNTSDTLNPKWTEGRVGGAIEFVSAFDGWQSTTPSELVVVQCPTMEDAKASGLLVRPSQLFGVSKNSAHQDVALDFVQFMMSDPDGVKALGTTRGVPASAAARQILADDGQLNPMLQEAVDAAVPNAFKPESAYTSNTEIKVAGEQTLEAMGYGKMTPQEAAKHLMEEYTRILGTLE